MRVTSFLMKSVLLSSFLGFVVKGSLRVQWQSGSGGSVVGGVVEVGVEMEGDGCVSPLRLVLVEFEAEGENFFWRRVRNPARGYTFPLRVRSS